MLVLRKVICRVSPRIACSTIGRFPIRDQSQVQIKRESSNEPTLHEESEDLWNIFMMDNDDGIAGITQEPDWAQAFAQKGVKLFSGYSQS